jgi:hypothetical protein
MTAIYSLPPSISDRFRFRSKPVRADAIKVVIPTYNDWDGLRLTLDSLLKLTIPPKIICVANDNPTHGVPDWLAQYPVEVVDYTGNLGPARARNKGFGLCDELPVQKMLAGLLAAIENRTGLPDYLRNGYCPELKYRDHDKAPKSFEWESDTDWVYFTDCGCTHAPDLFTRFEEAWQACGDCCVAISAPVTGSGPGLINEYMTDQGHLNPPRIKQTKEEQEKHGISLPEAIITANALIAALPFAFLGGFDPAFPEAAGEDLDLGIRLREFGIIAWADKAIVAHRFDEDEADFTKRFRRYGRGARRLELKHGLPSMRSNPFPADRKDHPGHQRLATLAHDAMSAGYNEIVDEADRGVLRII